MERAVASVTNTRSESFTLLRPSKARRSSLRSSSPPAAQARLQSMKLARFRQFVSFEFHTVADSYRGIGTLLKRSDPNSLHFKSSGLNGACRGTDLPLGSLNARRLQSHRASGKLDTHGRGVVDSPAASVAIVDKARRMSNSLVLTAGDLSSHSSNSERSELGVASQNSLVLPEKAGGASRKLCVAVDVDEVLGSFLAALNLFIEETYWEHHDISDYYIYDFMKIWNCSQMEANHRVHAFFDSDHFKNGISPIPGAHRTLLQLAPFCQLVVVTSRQNVIKERTLEWIDRYYAGIFKEVHFGNHFALDGPSRRKSEICRCLGANVLIDDNPRYAIDCAESGIEVLLFDLHGGYPWSKTPCGPQHALITRVRDWQEVEQALLARTCAALGETNS